MVSFIRVILSSTGAHKHVVTKRMVRGFF